MCRVAMKLSRLLASSFFVCITKNAFMTKQQQQKKTPYEITMKPLKPRLDNFNGKGNGVI